MKYIMTDCLLCVIYSETFEMTAQIWALLIYGGVQAVSISSDLLLAQEPKFIRSFADIIGCNAVFAGLLWVLYVNILM